MDDSVSKTVVKVQQLSGFDKSFQNLLTSKVGTITPILVDEVIPNQRTSVKMAISGALPPLASETFMRCSLKCEAFFVPMRLLFGSFEDWFATVSGVLADGDSQEIETTVHPLPPTINFPQVEQGEEDIDIAAKTGPGSLLDYLGFRSPLTGSNVAPHDISALPVIAYHKIYDDWYRNSKVQRPVFVREVGNSFVAAHFVPYFYTSSEYGYALPFDSVLADGSELLALRQRNFGMDYFTSATPDKQLGTARRVTFSTSGQTGGFTIEQLRAENSLQQFEERNNLPGTRLVEQVRARYGANLSDGVTQRSLLLGSADFEVYSKGIYQTDTGDNGNINNPMAGVPGARFGSAYASGQDFIINNFVSNEPGYIFIMATLVPRVTYSSGIRRYLQHYVGDGSIADMANPILQNVGPQPVYASELIGDAENIGAHVFGYTDRYAEFCTREDELHGLLRDGQSLQSFALQRSFAPDARPEINSDFLRIPTNYLDQVAAVDGAISQYGVWIDAFFDYKVVQPLAKYRLPSLQDPAWEHGDSVVINKAGKSL